MGLWRGLLATTTLCWSGATLLCSLQILLPAQTLTLWLFTVIAKEASLLVAVFALLGIILAVLLRFSGAPKRATVAAALSMATIFFSLIPMVQAWRVASEEGVPLSLSKYFMDLSFTADISPESVTYAHPGGEELKLDVWGAPGDGAGGPQRRPAVVLVHGGGWHGGSRSQTPQWDTWFAERGYVTFDIDYRLAPPPRWQDATGDVKCAVGWVKRNADRYNVDPERIALVGYSAGGHLALLAAYTAGNSYLPPSCDVGDSGVSAVAAFYPPTDLRRLYGMEWPWSSPNVVGLDSTRRFLGGTPSTVPDRYLISSPINHVDPDDPPTLLIHGGADRLVPLEQSELLAGRLREAGVPNHLVELPWANHSFDHAFGLSWSGWGSQISRSALARFMERQFAAASDSTVSSDERRSYRD